MSEENAAAVRLYRRHGYLPLATRPVVPYPGIAFGGDWLLMTRAVKG